MNISKKILCIIIVLSFVALATACGVLQTTSSSSGNEPASSSGSIVISDNPSQDPSTASSSQQDTNQNAISPELSSTLEPSSAPSEKDDGNNSNAISGNVVTIGDQRLLFAPDTNLGTQEELDTWYNAVSDWSSNVKKVIVNNMGDLTAELSEKEINAIMEILVRTDLKIYEQLGNPPTGGTAHVVAYDVSDNLLWHIGYNGEWVMIQQGNSSIVNIFNGEGTQYEYLPALIS